MGRMDGIRNRVAELLDASRDEEPEPEGYQGEERSSGLIRGGVLEHNPPDEDLQFYRQLYENVGPIKSAIDNYSSEVIEPGWYITADNEETREKLTEYFNNVAILNTETDVNGSVLMETMVREREIRGTVFLEKVRDSNGRNQALYPLQNDTITIYTKPGKAMLPAPTDTEAEAFDPDVTQQRDQPPLTADGEMGAYVQFDEIKPKWSNTEEVVYTRDDVLKWTRDADIGDPRGTSRIASSAQRAEGLLEKLQDNDDAVKFKAWPQIIFEMGNEDNPWSEDEVNDFIEHYEDENMRPGLMQAVAGDVDIKEFAGETADIEETLNFDISMIMSGLPGPVYATGGFSQNVAPAVAQSQQRQFIKEVKKTRRELEDLFTPYLREVAEEYNLPNPDSVELHVGRPEGEVAPEDIEGSIIRYTSDAQAQDDVPVTPTTSEDVVNDPDEEDSDSQSDNQTTSGGEDGTQGASPNQTNNANQANNASMAAESLSPNSSGTDPFRFVRASRTETLDGRVDGDAAELADPRLVSTAEFESELADLIYEELLSVRETLAETFEETSDRPLRNAGEMEDSATRAVESAVSESAIDARSRPHFEDTIESTLDTMGQDNHDVTMDIDMSARHRQRSRFLSDNMADSFENAVNDMLEFAHVNTRQAVQHGESPQFVAERLKESYSDADLRDRANVMARTEIMSGVNSLKMSEYDRHDDIIGVKLINPCNENTTPLCKQLACDDHTEAVFDADDTLGQQFQSETDDELLFDGFDPLPTVPPFHFNCRTEIVPITE